MLVAVLVSALVAVGPAEASILEGLGVAELRSRASLVVTGKVVGSRGVWTGATIETETVIRVEKRWRGDSDRLVTVRTPGGVADGRRLVVAGSPVFARGERLLLFLYASGDVWKPVGLFQGVWRLDDVEEGVARASAAAGATLVRRASGSLAVDRDQRTVRQLVGRGGGQ